MIILDATTKSLEMILAGSVTTNQLPFVATYVDVTTTAFTPGSSDGASNNTSTVTLVAAPSASTQRQIKFLSIQNADTVSATVTVRYNDNATTRIITKTILTAGDTLQYNDGEGFRVLDTNGSLKQSIAFSLTGDVTGTGSTSVATTIANSAVTLAKMANMADQTILGNNSGGAAAPIALTATQTKTVLSLNNVTNNSQVIKASSSTSGSLPKWSGTGGDTIIDGYSVTTSLGSPGSDTIIATEKAVRSALTAGGYGNLSGPATNTANYVPQWNGANSLLLKDGLAVGVGANNLVQLDGSSKLPAVDGSQLTNLNTLAFTARKTANYTAASGEIVLVDTTYSPVTVTLPASPTTNNLVSVVFDTTVTRYSAGFVAASTQYLSRADNTLLDLTGDFTVEYWVYHATQPTSTNYMDHVSKYDTTGNQRSYIMGYHNDSGTLKLSMRLSSDGISATEQQVTQTLSNSTWYHIAWAYTASTGSCVVYVNGASVGTLSSLPTSVFNSTSAFNIGRAGSLGQYMNGQIDDVRLWKGTVRSAGNISANYQTELVGNESGLTSYWNLNNALTDSTSGGLTLTNNNTVTFSSSLIPFAAGLTINGNGKNISGVATKTTTTVGDSFDMRYNNTQWNITSYVHSVP